MAHHLESSPEANPEGPTYATLLEQILAALVALGLAGDVLQALHYVASHPMDLLAVLAVVMMCSPKPDDTK